jgi:hypothetical protein
MSPAPTIPRAFRLPEALKTTYAKTAPAPRIKININAANELLLLIAITSAVAVGLVPDGYVT